MKLAFLVPYRDDAKHVRRRHLHQFVPHYRRRFPKAPIYIIEQGDDKPFNRGKLLNAGFKEFQQSFDYVALHDIDMLVSKGDYSYPSCPTQLATRVQQFKYKMPFPEYFGGVTLFRKEDFILCDGFSNSFWSYGGEDEELRKQVLKSGLKISHRDCFYESLHHERFIDPVLHPKNIDLVKTGRGENDGLAHCEYEIKEIIKYPDYKKMIVEI